MSDQWYASVTNDIANLPSCIDYYYRELSLAQADVKISGNLESLSAKLPGIVESRFNQLQELEAILEYLNIEMRRVRSRVFRKYFEQYQKSLSSRDCEKYTDGDIEVISMEKVINEFAMLRNKWLGIIKGLDIKGFQINNVIKLRTAGFEDIML